LLVHLNSKGQLTVPNAIRRKLGIHGGDVLELEVRGESLILRPHAATGLALRHNPASILLGIEGTVNFGGHAAEDAEALYDNP